MLSFAFILAAQSAGRLFLAPARSPVVGPGAYDVRMPAPQQPLYRLGSPEMRVPDESAPWGATPSFPQVAAAAPLLLALPAYADDGGIFDVIVNAVLSVIVLGFIGFILKFAFDVFSEVGSQAGERAERLGLTGNSGGGEKSNEPIYDDTDYSYKDLSKRVENSRTRQKKSKQFKADGTRLAPWMVIDEDKVEQMKKAREERIAKEKAGPSKNFWER